MPCSSHPSGEARLQDTAGDMNYEEDHLVETLWKVHEDDYYLFAFFSCVLGLFW